MVQGHADDEIADAVFFGISTCAKVCAVVIGLAVVVTAVLDRWLS